MKQFILLFFLLLVLTASVGLSPPEALNSDVAGVWINQSDQTGQITLPNSLTAINSTAEKVNTTCPIFFVEMELQKQQNPLTITEGLAVKKFISSLNLNLVLQAKPPVILGASNIINASTGNNVATLLRDDRGHIIKVLMTSACLVAFTGQIS